jgi:HK97 gp10 family phage protein
MAFKVSISIGDERKLKERMERAPQHVRKAFGIAMQKSALLVEADAKRRTPVDTGRLRASIYTKIGLVRSTVQPKTNYALYVHEGTRHMRPRPYMEQAAEAMEGRVQKIFLKEIDKAI